MTNAVEHAARVNGQLAAERQQPLTAAEHSQVNGRQGEYARDVPRTCNGAHQWNGRKRRYELIGHPEPGCPWHTARPGEEGGGDGV